MWATSFLPPPGVVVNVQLVSVLPTLCFLDCFFELWVILRSKSFVFSIVKKWWLQAVPVPKCVGSKWKVMQELVLFPEIRFWTSDQMKMFVTEQACVPSQCKQQWSLGQCLCFENKWKPKHALGRYNCSNHLPADGTGRWCWAAAQVTPPQLTFPRLPKTEKRVVNWKMQTEWWGNEHGFYPREGLGGAAAVFVMKGTGEH